jgi:hypothetical protein
MNRLLLFTIAFVTVALPTYASTTQLASVPVYFPGDTHHDLIYGRASRRLLSDMGHWFQTDIILYKGTGGTYLQDGTHTAVTYSQVQLYSPIKAVIDNEAGDCATASSTWTYTQCIAGGGLLAQIFIPSPLTASAWSSFAQFQSSYNDPSITFIPVALANATSSASLEASGVTPSSLVSFMLTQMMLVVGSGLGMLLLLVPYIVALVIIGAIVYFLYRAFRLLRH